MRISFQLFKVSYLKYKSGQIGPNFIANLRKTFHTSQFEDSENNYDVVR